MADKFLDYKVPVSQWQKTTKYLMYHLSARKVFREILKWMNVPVYDCSCPEDTVGQPVRISSGKLQTYNGTTWVDLVVSGGTSTIIPLTTTTTAAPTTTTTTSGG